MIDELPDNPANPNQEQYPEGPIMPSAQPQRAYEQHQEENKSSFSGLLILLLLILMIAAGFYVLKFVKQKQEIKKAEPVPIVNVVPPVEKKAEKPKAPAPAPEEEKVGTKVKMPEKRPETVVKEFYDWLLSQPGDVIQDGRYKDRPEIYKDFIQKIEKRKGEGLHPFLCSATSAAKADVQPPKTNAGQSSIAVNLTENDKVTTVKLTLKLNGAWTITNTLCLSQASKRSVIENLKLETGLDYTTLKDMSFLWSIPDYKGQKTKTLKGKGFSTENTTVDPSVFENFFLKSGFKKDTYNKDGYLKEKMACVAHVDKTETGRFNIEAVCANL